MASGKLSATKIVAVASLAMIAALMIVGAVSSGVLRHLVQTAPLWLAVYLGFGDRKLVKWAALPTYVFWLLIMALIWMYLLGVASIASGRYSPVEVAMTVVVGVASVAGIVQSLRLRSGVGPATALLVFLAVLGVQIGAFALSLQPGIADR